jgi:hypothetical protein
MSQNISHAMCIGYIVIFPVFSYLILYKFADLTSFNNLYLIIF